LKTDYRIGFGYDVHALAHNRKLMLGGIEVPFDRGLEGHSDADVLLHAIADALLGALALGDIGRHFPDSDKRYKDADSRILLTDVYAQIKSKGYRLANLDSTIAAQRPKLAGFIDQMRASIADILECGIDRISIKATTTEKLGFVGLEEGIEAFASVLLQSADD
jgi:2-C-methyl-D-erythritol 2,4-cyclodiphosphate synthase